MTAGRGRRIEWHDVPRRVRAALDDALGSPIVEAINASGGFSPGPAARCALADGRRVFVKACGSELNPLSPALHRREVEVVRLLPPGLPTPQLLDVYDDGDWVALVFEQVRGHMPVATDPADVRAMLDMVGLLAERGTPGPRALPTVGTIEGARGDAHRWPTVAADASLEPRLDDWTRRHLAVLADMEATWIAAAAGDSLVHGDLRADNVLIGESETWVVDWPSAAIGAEWLDLVGMLPALHIDGGPPPSALFDTHPIGRRADADAVNSYLAGLLGYFTHEALLPAPPGLPTLRGFQRAQGAVVRDWLSRRTGLR